LLARFGGYGLGHVLAAAAAMAVMAVTITGGKHHAKMTRESLLL
jgi:hypothetical protein